MLPQEGAEKKNQKEAVKITGIENPLRLRGYRGEKWHRISETAGQKKPR